MSKNIPEITTYLTNLITEKGKSLDTEIKLEGHFGLTYGDLVNFIEGANPSDIKTIRHNCVKIDFMNGDVFHFLDYCAAGMVKSLGY